MTAALTTGTHAPGTTQEALHRRSAALRRAARSVEEGRPLPWDAGLAELFTDRDDLLRALHDRWSRQLLARVDVALELGEGTQEESVARAWRSAVRDQPGVRRLLDAERESPALRSGRRSLLAAVAVAAGLATFDDPAPVAVAAGAALLDRVDATTTDTSAGPSLLRRVLSRIWDGPVAADRWPWAA